MTAEEFRVARETLGLSTREMAIALGLAPSSGRNLREYERDGGPGPPARLATIMRELLRGYRPAYYPKTRMGRSVAEGKGDV